MKSLLPVGAVERGIFNMCNFFSCSDPFLVQILPDSKVAADTTKTSMNVHNYFTCTSESSISSSVVGPLSPLKMCKSDWSKVFSKSSV